MDSEEESQNVSDHHFWSIINEYFRLFSKNLIKTPKQGMYSIILYDYDFFSYLRLSVLLHTLPSTILNNYKK